MSDRTNAKRQEALRQRRSEAGLVRVEVYVHAANRKQIRELARDLEAPPESA